MRFFQLLICVLFASLFSTAASAEWIQVTGQADFDGQRYDLARDRARKDAIKQALIQAGARVKSDQSVKNGMLNKDYFSVSSEARIRKSVLEDEYVKKGILSLVMNFDVEKIASCPDSQAKKYRKKIAVLGFSVQSPAQLRLGRLQNIERGLASVLNQSLQGQDKLVVYEQSGFALHQDVINAPSHFTSQSTLTKAADYAKQVGAQFAAR